MKRSLFALLLIFAILLTSCGGTTIDTGLPETTDPVLSDPDTTEPNATESDITAPDTTEPDETTGGETPDDEQKPDNECADHKSDKDNDGYCDDCGAYVVFVVDLLAVNDLHGKVADSDTQPGVDELTTYIKNMRKTDNVVLLSSGDMWQGSSESNLTGGLFVTEWMNDVGFVSMTLGNHEYDWGEEYIEANLKIAEFPFLAINIYDRDTDKRVEYCQPSVIVEAGGVTIGIIGAMGDCYSSISRDKVEGVYFKTGSELTALVKAESERLRAQGVDLIVYSLHDGKGYDGGSSDSQIRSFYDVALSDGYVDIVFEGHSHQSYTFKDGKGVYHLQGGGDNKGITHAEIVINVANDSFKVQSASTVSSSRYTSLADDPIVETLLKKYEDQISVAGRELGTNNVRRDGNFLRQTLADLYLEVGEARWGDKYDIVLGGGYFSVRSPGFLAPGPVTYGDLQMLFPFDNTIVLCSVSGSKLLSRFVNTNNSNYFMGYSDYGNRIKGSIDRNATYYVIVDSYSSSYAPNGLTVVDEYDAGVYARDLLAAYIEEGGFGSAASEYYTLTPIPDILSIGKKLADNAETKECYYVRGKVVSIENQTYGNMTIEDGLGNRLYVYGVYDVTGGVRYDAMSPRPAVGDTIVLCAPVKKFVYAGNTTIELINARTLSIE